VKAVCREIPGGGVEHMVTRETGSRLRRAFEAALAELQPGGILTLDFTGAGIIDFSCADEALAKLVGRLVAGEYGEKYLRLKGLSPSQRENIQVALERKRLSTLLLLGGESWDCLGTVKPYLRETLELVMRRRTLSAREMAGILDLELNASSTRLINLHRQRLVTRREHAKGEGGREFIYEGLLSVGAAPGGTGG
jgi:hypothetical protein